MRTLSKEKTLAEWREIIRREKPFVDVKPFSHNVISLALSAISKGWGDTEANKVIKDFKLARLGWQKETENFG